LRNNFLFLPSSFQVIWQPNHSSVSSQLCSPLCVTSFLGPLLQLDLPLVPFSFIFKTFGN
jgi:hypothetical protein